MNDLPMHPIPERLRLIQINSGGPATISCAEGVRSSSRARQRAAPSFQASKSHLGHSRHFDRTPLTSGLPR